MPYIPEQLGSLTWSFMQHVIFDFVILWKKKKPEMIYDNDISTDYKKTSDKKYTHLHSSSFVVLGKLININRRYNKRIFLILLKMKLITIFSI